jgi:hypothetical protein
VKLYTAQYRYSGDDRPDIAFKGKDPIGDPIGAFMLKIGWNKTII